MNQENVLLLSLWSNISKVHFKLLFSEDSTEFLLLYLDSWLGFKYFG